jgi:DNA primase
VEFAIRGKLAEFDLDTTEGRLAALDAAAPLINRLKDRGLRHRYAVNLDNWLGFLDEEFVVRRVAEHPSHGGGEMPGTGSLRPRPARLRPREGVTDDAAVTVEREVLKVALQYPGLAGPAVDALPAEVFTVPAYRAVHTAIATAGGVCAGLAAAGDVPGWVSLVVTAAGDDELRRFVTGLAVETVFCNHDVDDRYVDEQMSRIQELHVTRRIADLKSRVQRLNPVTDAETFKRAYGELIALEQHKRQLRERGLGAA